MRISKETKAISTLLLILLILCSAILGALVSYMWVMSSYYNMPEDSTLLIVENVNFPIGNFSYFDLTVLNPSNSASDVNISAFHLTIEETNETYEVATTEYPEQLPFPLTKGTRQTFKCIQNWSNFTGDTVRIEPVAGNSSIKSFQYTTPKEKLTITPTFDSTESVEYFNLTVENSADSITNLTISEVTVFAQKIASVTPTLPCVLPPNQTQMLRCNANWDSLRGQNVTVAVATAEGYESSYVTSGLLGAIVSIDEIKFDYENPGYFNVTARNAQDSTAAVILSRINVTVGNETAIIQNTIPPLNISVLFLPPNQTEVVKCIWDWTAQRNKTITVSVFTRQGFTAPMANAVTPVSVVWNITEVKFDLNDTNHFLVNVANTPCSLNAINITNILLNGTATVLHPPFAVLTNGTQAMLNCTLDWTNLRGINTTITAITADGLNISIGVSVPSIGLELLEDRFVFGTLQDPVTNFTIPYFNVTISNSANSLLDNVTITKIVLQTGSTTYEIDSDITNPIIGQQGHPLKRGETLTFMCLFNWVRYLATGAVKATVYTANGSQASRTWQFTP